MSVRPQGYRHPRNLPWIIAAAVIGCIVVAGIAVAIAGGSTGPAIQPGQVAPGGASQSPQPVSSADGSLSYGVTMTEGYEQPATTVPDKGTFVRIIYRGGYDGTCTTGNSTVTIHNSGERYFALENPGSTVTAVFRKLDNSAKQVMTVEIWNDGSRMTSGSVQDPHGEVRISTALR